MRRIITLTLLTLACFILQTTVFTHNNLIVSSPDLMLILTMSFGIMRGRKEGMLIGLLSGFLYDVFYSSFIGPFMLLYMIIGYANGFFHRSYLMEDVMLPVIIIALDEITLNFVIYIFGFLLRNKQDFSQFFNVVILPETLYSVLITVILYRIFVSINKHIKKKAHD